MVTDNRVIWAAGLFDGEGCIQIKGQNRLLVVRLDMTCEQTVKRFQSLFKVGSIHNVPAKGKNRPKFAFCATGKDAYNMLKLMSVWIFTKRQQLELALEWGEKCMDFQRGVGVKIPAEIMTLREVIFDEMKELNKRGHDPE